MPISRAPRNRTLTVLPGESRTLAKKLIQVTSEVSVDEILNKTIHQDVFEVLEHLPQNFVDLLIVDPPYKKRKTFNGAAFTVLDEKEYAEWVERWLLPLLIALKPTASIYVCSDWQTSSVLQSILSRHLIVRNRITWEREKGRGARTNWKSTAEDIWFCTVSDDYYFDVEAVKLRRAVKAPYRVNGQPKDWVDGANKYRETHPSNFWGDLTVPFWSMPENTDHPTQKPEKLIAKLVLASSKPGGVILDPFLGSGTTSVVAKKLGRQYIGIEREREFALVAEKRLERAESEPRIQGYEDGVFRERNSK